MTNPTQRLEEPSDSKTETAAAAGSTGRSPGVTTTRLAIWIIVGTVIGELLGILANIADATGLAEPLANLIDPAPQLQVVGSNTILGDELLLASDWQADFVPQTAYTRDYWFVGELQREAQIHVRDVGTEAGFDAAARREVDLLVASEPLPDERLAELSGAGVELRCAAEIGYDVIALVTSIAPADLRPITVNEWSQILSGLITNWRDVGGPDMPIVIFARSYETSGTTKLMIDTFASPDRYAPLRPCSSNDDCMNRTVSTPGAVTWVSTAWLRGQPRQYLRTVPIVRDRAAAAQDPIAENFDPDLYPEGLIRPLYMYALRGNGIEERSSTLAEQMLYYVRGVRGQALLQEHGFYPLFSPPANTQPVRLPPGFGEQNGELQICRP